MNEDKVMGISKHPWRFYEDSSGTFHEQLLQAGKWVDVPSEDWPEDAKRELDAALGFNMTEDPWIKIDERTAVLP